MQPTSPTVSRRRGAMRTSRRCGSTFAAWAARPARTTKGGGEVDDAAAALDWLAARRPACRSTPAASRSAHAPPSRSRCVTRASRRCSPSASPSTSTTWSSSPSSTNPSPSSTRTMTSTARSRTCARLLEPREGEARAVRGARRRSPVHWPSRCFHRTSKPGRRLAGEHMNLTRRETLAVLAAAPLVDPKSAPAPAPALMPLGFNPAKLKGLSEKLLTSHPREQLRRGVSRTLAKVREELGRANKDNAGLPHRRGPQRARADVRELRVTLHEAYFANLGGDGKVPAAFAAFERSAARVPPRRRPEAAGGLCFPCSSSPGGPRGQLERPPHAEPLASIGCRLLVVDMYEQLVRASELRRRRCQVHRRVLREREVGRSAAPARGRGEGRRAAEMKRALSRRAARRLPREALGPPGLPLVVVADVELTSEARRASTTRTWTRRTGTYVIAALGALRAADREPERRRGSQAPAWHRHGARRRHRRRGQFASSPPQ